jgi:magnesium chelatase subunit I
MEAIFSEGGIVIYDESTEAEYKNTLDNIKPLEDLVKKYQTDVPSNDRYFLKDFVLWALAEHHKLGKDRLTDGFQFKDLLDIL